MVAIVQKKNKLVGFQADETMHRRVKDAARIRGFGTYADWMRQLTAAALDSSDAAPTAYDPNVIAKLAEIYAGYFAPRISASLAQRGIDQPALLHQLLQQLQEAFACGCTTIDDIAVVPRSELRADHPWYRPSPDQLALAAEDPEPYSPRKSSAAEQPRIVRKSDIIRATPPVPAPGKTG